MLTTLASGMLKSIMIYALTLLGSLPLGMLVAFGRMSRCGPLKLFVKFYISVMRGTPLMLQLMVVFFGPYYLFRLNLGSNYRLIAVIIGFVINYAAYFAEIYRGGIESISVGQREAAQVLGYSRTSAFLRIILPQVIKRIIPSVTNEMITLVKDTSLAFAISYSEMFTMAKKIASSQATLLPFVIAGAFYYIFNFAVAYGMERFEKRLSYYR
jgi:polar amino acid transport system permease protein